MHFSTYEKIALFWAGREQTISPRHSFALFTNPIQPSQWTMSSILMSPLCSNLHWQYWILCKNRLRSGMRTTLVHATTKPEFRPWGCKNSHAMHKATPWPWQHPWHHPIMAIAMKSTPPPGRLGHNIDATWQQMHHQQFLGVFLDQQFHQAPIIE